MSKRTPPRIEASIEALLTSSMRGANGRYVPARLQCALALLERLRIAPTLQLVDHLAGKGSSGLKSHETFGDQAHSRFGLEPINKIHGRRSSNLQEWGQPLLDVLRDAGFAQSTVAAKDELINVAQSVFANNLRKMLDEEPLLVRVRGRSAYSVIRDLLEQADEKGKSGEVAQYLVGAKLVLRFGQEIGAVAANKADRKSRSDRNARPGDFEIADAVIEVALGFPDKKHIEQIAEVLEGRKHEFWLLTRDDRLDAWKKEVASNMSGQEEGRVVINSVEAFVGQNVTELGEFSAEGKANRLQDLFAIYNEQWVSRFGPPGIRIEIK